MDPLSMEQRRDLVGPGMAIGLLILAFGWGDFVLTLPTPHLADPHWRFAVADAMAGPVWSWLVGSLLLLWFAQAAGHRTMMRLGSALCLCQAIALLGALAIFPLDFVSVRRDVLPDAQWGFRVAAARTALTLLASSGLFFWLTTAGFGIARGEQGNRGEHREIPLIVGMELGRSSIGPHDGDRPMRDQRNDAIR
ncbi:MAG: hypothetical protein ABJC74_09615 [Gemmatimonadota bacterium]